MEKEHFEAKRSSEWRKSILQLPGIGKVTTMLQKKEACSKLNKAIKFVRDGHVQQVLIASSSKETFLLKCKALASMKQVFYDVYIELTSEGVMKEAYCECVAGKGQSCHHIAALLYFVKEAQATQETENVPNGPVVTSTDVACSWNGVAQKKTVPAPLDEIVIVRHKEGKEKRDKKQTLQSLNFDPRHPDHRSVDPEAFKKLYEGLKKIHPMLGFCKYAVPLPPLPAPEPTNDTRHESCVLQHPASLHDIRTACSSMKASVQLTAQEIEDLEQKTREQNMSEMWHENRRIRITASKFHQVINMRRTTCPTGFLKLQLYSDNRRKTKAMKLGLEREDSAAHRYQLHQQLQGEHLTLSKAGLRISSDKGFLGASVDRIATDNTGKIILVELKNPDNTWNVGDIMELPVRQKCLIKVTNDDGTQSITINRKHAYYMQIQGQMFVYNCDVCDFVVCTNYVIFIERVQRDHDFINQMLNKLEAFYDNILLPEIVYPRVKYGLPPLNLHNM